MPIGLLIVDDQQIICRGLESLLSAQPDLEVLGTADNGHSAIATIEQLIAQGASLDVVLMDIRMPILNGINATRTIRQRFPQLKVLVLTTFDDTAYIAQAIQAGALGYLLKDTPSDQLADTIRAVSKGYSQLGPGLLAKALNPLPEANPLPSIVLTLTPREQEVLKLIAQGASNREIAAALFLTERTVKNYVTKILSTLDLRDRTQVALFAAPFLDVLAGPEV
jgi:DNA-binding NarL/FixJ family response regulator